MIRNWRIRFGGVGFRIDLRNEEVFVRIDKAMDRVLESDSGGSLTISVAPMYACSKNFALKKLRLGYHTLKSHD